MFEAQSQAKVGVSDSNQKQLWLDSPVTGMSFLFSYPKALGGGVRGRGEGAVRVGWSYRKSPNWGFACLNRGWRGGRAGVS